MPKGIYKHKTHSDEIIEKQRQAYYKWSGRKDPGNILEKTDKKDLETVKKTS